jgi:hypothetical protein
MVRPGRDPLAGVVEVDEAYWGGEETGATGRQTDLKTRIIVAAEEDGNGIGRIRLRTIPDVSKASLHGFIRQAIAPGSTVRTDGWPAYRGLAGYVHDRQAQSHQPEEEHLLPRAHRVISLLKRWLLGTHQGAVSPEHMDEGLRKQRLVERALSYCYGASKPLFSFCEDFRGQISGSVALFRAGFIGYASSTDGRGLGAQRQPDLPSFASAIGSRV